MGTEERKEVQPKGINNVFNKIIVQKFPSLEKKWVIQVLETFRTSNRPDQKRSSP
jgi:hypothetical protein